MLEAEAEVDGVEKDVEEVEGLVEALADEREEKIVIAKSMANGGTPVYFSEPSALNIEMGLGRGIHETGTDYRMRATYLEPSRFVELLMQRIITTIPQRCHNKRDSVNDTQTQTHPSHPPMDDIQTLVSNPSKQRDEVSLSRHHDNKRRARGCHQSCTYCQRG